MGKKYEDMSRTQLLKEIKSLTEARKQLTSAESEKMDNELQAYEIQIQQDQLDETRHLLEISRDAYAELYDFAPIAYFTFDRNGVISEMNLTACSLLNIERGRVLGIPFITFIAEPDRRKFLDHMRRCRTGEYQINTELTLKTRSATEIPIVLSSRVLPDANCDTIRTIAIDLTERRDAESKITEMNASLEQRVTERTADLERINSELSHQVLQRLAVERELQESHARKDEFLAMLGHELRNPLGPLRHAVEIWRLGEVSSEQLIEIQEVADRQVRHMAQVVDDILDVSRITSGKIHLRHEAIDLSALIHDVTHDFRSSFESNRIKLNVEYTNSPIWTAGDPLRLTQVITNLLHNANKFTPVGGNVFVSLTENADSSCTISVRDDGIGIDPAMIGQLFLSFSQSKRRLDRSLGGLGLGLSLVKGIAELHGGSVAAYSDGIDRGAEFLVRLPTIHPDLPIIERPDIIPDSTQHYRVLVIDDQRDSLFMMSTLLKRLGHTVAVAQSGREGLHVIKTFQPNIIFSDIGLPGMNGYEIARRIRADSSITVNRLVAMTGYGQVTDRERAFQSGFDEHLTKPVGIQDLIKIVANQPSREL